jgi:lysophospholipase L1-like esterase
MRIVIWGDSITWGAYDPENGGWVNLLRNYLEPRDISVYNCGIPGDNTNDLLKRFHVEAEAREPEVVVFAIGINDSQYTGSRDNSRVPKDKFVANLESLITQAKEFTDKIAFVGLTHVEENKVMPIHWSDENKNYDNTNIDLYNSIIKRTSEKNNAPFLNILGLINVDELEDGLHPNSKGHKKIFVKARDFLTENKWI